jgi:hypothetical protein
VIPVFGGRTYSLEVRDELVIEFDEGECIEAVETSVRGNAIYVSTTVGGRVIVKRVLNNLVEVVDEVPQLE